MAGVYAQRAIRESRARSLIKTLIPVTVQQQSNEFSFSKVEQDRTIFTVRASRATQYKEQNRALLQDVWITIYGREGNRNDNIHTSECNYEPTSGNVTCQGEVKIDLASTGAGKPADSNLQVTTRNLSFNRETGEASTAEPVQFRFAGGQGHAVGVTYSSQNEIVRLTHDVELDMAPSPKTGDLPVSAAGSSLEIRRNDRIVELAAPAVVKQGNRELAADKILIELDSDFRARHAVASGHPRIRSIDAKGELTASANQFEASLDSAGWVQQVTAEGNVDGTRRAADSTDHFSMAHAIFVMERQHNLVRTLTAWGQVALDSRQGSDARSLQTESLLVNFAPGNKPNQTLIESAETKASGTIVSKTANDTTKLSARKFVARFNPQGHMEELLGHSGAEIQRQFGAAAPQNVKSQEFVARFSPDGQWSTLDESGGVVFAQADHRASAARASIVRATDTITMDGSPVISDSMSRTTAENVTIHQKSGEIRADGKVVSTFQQNGAGSAMNLGSGPGHISAETLSGSTTSGHVTYSGHARLWQGESVLESGQIEIWRDDKKLQARENVVAVFPQASQAARPFAEPSPHVPSSSPPSAPAGPTLWTLRAPLLTYWSDAGKAHLEGGVKADSQQGSMQSPTLDVFLASAATKTPSSLGSAAQRPHKAPELRTEAPTSAGVTPADGQQLQRALALGGVTVRQGDRIGTAEQAEYIAADGRFVLSGGHPTIIDAASDATTGHSLTFFVANDTILIDSQQGSRTLTKHRVEK
ncbi:MAG: LPS export ABC transporter periplasmic protein LptC [Candidatus Acidiferrales bacterium]